MTEPLRAPEPARGRTPAEEARTLVAAHASGLLSTLTADGDPWGSLVAYGTLPDGAPVLHVSTLAEHGRNLARDGRASLVVAEDSAGGDPLDSGRVTLAGRAERPAGARPGRRGRPSRRRCPARRATRTSPTSRSTCSASSACAGSAASRGWTRSARTPTARRSRIRSRGRRRPPSAISTTDHADALLAMAAGPGGFTDATAAVCVGADRYGLDL